MHITLKRDYHNQHSLMFAVGIFLSFVLTISICCMDYNLYAVQVNNDSMNQATMKRSMTEMMERGNVAMGFNQNKIAHQFVSTPFGGKIIITALNDSDTNTISQIKNHTLEIQKEFSQGNFTRPFFIHAQDVPGTKVMSDKKNLIKYDISETKNGSILTLTTNDTQLIDAINKFMQFQASQHHGH